MYSCLEVSQTLNRIRKFTVAYAHFVLFEHFANFAVLINISTLTSKNTTLIFFCKYVFCATFAIVHRKLARETWQNSSVIKLEGNSGRREEVTAA